MSIKVNIKAGFRELQVDEVKETPGGSGKWSEATDAQTGHTVFTSTDDAATATIVWGAGDGQDHDAMKTGSTIETWTDSAGKQHAVIRKKS